MTKPRMKTLTVTLESGEQVKMSSFTSLQVMEDERISEAYADIESAMIRLSDLAKAEYLVKVEKAGLTAEQAAELPAHEAIALGVWPELPTPQRIFSACRKPLAKLVRAALPTKDDAWFNEQSPDDLNTLIGAIHELNSFFTKDEQAAEQGNFAEALMKAAQSLEEKVSALQKHAQSLQDTPTLADGTASS